MPDHKQIPKEILEVRPRVDIREKSQKRSSVNIFILDDDVLYLNVDLQLSIIRY